MNKNNNPYKDFKRSDLGKEFARLQRVAQAMNIPILIIVDGWESSGRGRLIRDLLMEQNPKFYDVKVFDWSREIDKKYTYMTRFWKESPKKGNVKIFDRSYYFELLSDLELTDEQLEKRLREIEAFEKALYDDYTVIVKLFINISKENQAINIDEYSGTDYASFYLDINDKDQQERFDEYKEHFTRILESTNYKFAPWIYIDGNNIKDGSKMALGSLIRALSSGIERVATRREDGVRIKRNYRPTNFPINDMNLSKNISEQEYDEKLKPLQKRVEEICMSLYKKDIPVILAFEGVDAAGKDGAIKRLIKRVDPRLVKTHSISAPDETEKNHHYLWRFYNKFPKDGRIGIFSRSWYGRVMVERVEGFAEDNEWERAYGEILEMERELSSHGALILKYFVVIDKDTQLERFKDRENEPDKQYKITEEDWRNRDKWDEYIKVMNEMIDRTDAEYAPWILVEGNDKLFARIKVLETFIEYAEKFL